MTQRVETRNLGLAAYIKMHGEKLIDFVGPNRVFVFESAKPLSEWNVEYLNSESHKHDSELMNLRKLFQ